MSPYNDWWTSARPLSFAPNRLSREVATQVGGLVDASKLSHGVAAGILLLEQSPSYQNLRSSLSLQEQLRPLFCENEINLESDLFPLDKGAEFVSVPSAFIRNPMLGFVHVEVKRETYLSLLESKGLIFPETARRDADHAWLTPVKGISDLIAIESLITKGLIDREFAVAVLLVDSDTPVFSTARCSLLELIPPYSPTWQTTFRANLVATHSSAANELLRNIGSPRTLDASLRWHDNSNSAELFEKLLRVRKAAYESEISKNRLGQILEPGFRVIFPETAL
jgi:hypothetical protein